MFVRLLTVAIFAGAATGLVAAVLQLVFVQPVLLEAELYESGQLSHFDGGAAAGAAAELLAAGGVEWTRNLLTVLFTALVYTGYALLVVVGFALAERRGARITARTGILWGVAGFVAIQLAPAFGLPPELPGMSAADVGVRQLWWLFTVAATGGGLWLLAFGDDWKAWAPAVVLLLAPHLIGAPHPDTFAGPTPPELGGLFASRALGVGLAAWVLLGSFAGFFWQRELQQVPAGRTA